MFKFRYHAKYKNIGSENEICDVIRVRNIYSKDISINGTEISEHRFADVQQLREEVSENTRDFAPWFILVFQKLLENHL